MRSLKEAAENSVSPDQRTRGRGNGRAAPKGLLVFLLRAALYPFSLERVMSCPFRMKSGANMEFVSDF